MRSHVSQAVDLADVTTLAGGPEDVLTALESGVLDPESPVVIAGEENWPRALPTWSATATASVSGPSAGSRTRSVR